MLSRVDGGGSGTAEESLAVRTDCNATKTCYSSHYGGFFGSNSDTLMGWIEKDVPDLTSCLFVCSGHPDCLSAVMQDVTFVLLLHTYGIKHHSGDQTESIANSRTVCEAHKHYLLH